jgi:cytochrome c-type biogenesis protein CcmE
MKPMKPKTQRLVLVAAALAAVLVAVLLAMWGLRDRASYFYTPAEIAAGRAKAGTPVRLGGMVERGSVTHEADGVTTSFRVTDGLKTVRVRYRGILPNLFREGSGVVAEGQVEPMTSRDPAGKSTPQFVADNILAKHDEHYMPPELGNLAPEHTAGKTLQR